MWWVSMPLPLGHEDSVLVGWPSVRSIFVCQNSGVAAIAWDFQLPHKC